MIESAVGLDAPMPCSSAPKTGPGRARLLEAVVKRIPPPKGDPTARLQALVFDSWFDAYRGVVILTRVFQGTLSQGPENSPVAKRHHFDAETLGVQSPKPVEIEQLKAGEVGFLIANIKDCGRR